MVRGSSGGLAWTHGSRWHRWRGGSLLASACALRAGTCSVRPSASVESEPHNVKDAISRNKRKEQW
jgi:hypothetical protein